MNSGYLNPNSRAVLGVLVDQKNARGFAFVRGLALAKLAQIPASAVRPAARVLCRRNLAEYGYGGYAATQAGREWVRGK